MVSTTKPLEMLHIDLCGPIRVISRRGKGYILVIVDDYSRFTWTMFLATKKETYEVFEIFVRLVQKKHSTEVINIRSYHGSEFESSNFLNFCSTNGTDHNFSAPRTPQQNGVVERKNRTLENVTRTMLTASKLPQFYWAEAINTACYLINRCTIRTFLNKTPYELLKGRKPSLGHLRPFGAYVTCTIMERIIWVTLMPRVMKEYSWDIQHKAKHIKYSTKEQIEWKKACMLFFMKA